MIANIMSVSGIIEMRSTVNARMHAGECAWLQRLYHYTSTVFEAAAGSFGVELKTCVFFTAKQLPLIVKTK